jgi:signal transduction histidine kinase/ligand-binding sensor domain-containing protein
MKRGVLMALMWFSMLVRMSGQDPVFRRYTTADGLPSNSIYAVFQDRDGYMWFGTDGGVSRFDGHRFRNYGSRDGLTDVQVIGIEQDSKGRIWFLNLNGTLCYLLNDTVHNERTDPILGRNKARLGWQSFAEDGQGRLWFGSISASIRRMDLTIGTDTAWHLGGGGCSVLNSSDGKVRAVNQGVVHALSKDRWIPIDSLGKRFYTSKVYDVNGDGTHAVSLSEQGVMQLATSGWETLIKDDSLEQGVHELCWMDREGDVWVRCRPRGIERYVRDDEGRLHRKRYFGHESIGFAYVDRTGSHWFVTTRHGLLQCTAAEFRGALFPGHISPDQETMQVLAKDERGTLWAGSTEGGLYTLKRDGLLNRTPAFGSRNSGRILSMAADGKGGLWIGTDHTVEWLALGGARSLDVPILALPGRSPSWHGAKALAIGSDHQPLFGFFGIQELVMEGSAYVRRQCEIAGYGRINSMCVDRAARVWFESSGSLNMVAKGSLSELARANADIGARITSIAEWAQDTMIVATAGAGLKFVSRDRVVASIGLREGSPSEQVSRVRVFNDTLLICMNTGVQWMVSSTGARGPWKSVPILGLPRTDMNDALFQNGEVVVACGTGLCVVPIGDGSPQALPVARIIETWLNDSVPVAGSAISMDHTDEIRIVFSALVFDHPEDLIYEYRLHAHAAWLPVDDAQLRLSALGSGRYELGVRVHRPGGVAGANTFLTLSVRGPWWERPLARTILVVAVIALLFAASRWLTRRKYREMVATMREQAMMNEERGRIAADVHDDLGADISKVLMGLRMAELNDPAAGARAIVDAEVGLSGAMQRIDEIIWSLDPRRDTVLATANFIEAYAMEFAAQNDLEIISDVRIAADAAGLGAHVRRELFLVVREALRNIVQHARARRLFLSAEIERGVLRMEIADDGVGLATEPGRRQGNGVLNMRRRVENLGGTLQTESRSGGGTRIIVLLAVPRNPSIG